MLKTQLPNSLQNLTIATTGASGSIFLRHLLLLVHRDARVQSANFIASDSALRVMAEELGLRGRNNLVAQLLGHASRKIHQQANADIGANVASGSYPADAMIVLPCSVGTLARIANGVASQLRSFRPTISVPPHSTRWHTSSHAAFSPTSDCHKKTPTAGRDSSISEFSLEVQKCLP
jgi:hypothetical protein